MLLGDGASFSSGGPGKGLLSRFYTGVMSGSYGIDNVNSINFPFSDGGMSLDTRTRSSRQSCIL